DTDWGGLLAVAAERTGLFLLDYALWAVVGRWPWEFFVGRRGEGVGPWGWRRRVRFEEREVVVRRSRRWDRTLQTSGEGWDSVLKERIQPAVAPSWAKRKTGYAMLDKSWDLDFEAMVRAHELVREGGSVDLKAFEMGVWRFEDGAGWRVWRCDDEGLEGKEQTRGKGIRQMKDRLTQMGKENLFFEWVEMMQFESSGAERLRRARELFEAQGVDFERFWDGVEGGGEGMMDLEL
ncbi:MAG: hypothetical protein Q9195_008681, partial [Heterodermia aff. obscurata]